MRGSGPDHLAEVRGAQRAVRAAQTRSRPCPRATPAPAGGAPTCARSLRRVAHPSEREGTHRDAPRRRSVARNQKQNRAPLSAPAGAERGGGDRGGTEVQRIRSGLERHGLQRAIRVEARCAARQTPRCITKPEDSAAQRPTQSPTPPPHPSPPTRPTSPPRPGKPSQAPPHPIFSENHPEPQRQPVTFCYQK